MINQIKNKLKNINTNNIKTGWFCVISSIIIIFGWKALEFLFYQEIQHRIVDDIIAMFFIVSVWLNYLLIDMLKNEINNYINLKNNSDKSLETIEKLNDEWSKEYMKLYHALNTIKFNFLIGNKVIESNLRNKKEEMDEESFRNIESFAQQMKLLNDVNAKYIEKQLGEKEEC